MHTLIPFGEIVESSLQIWKVHCWQWDSMPALGSLVVVECNNQKLFGLVAQVSTGSIDQGRQPFPYQKTEEELKREQPQIFALLQTQAVCITLAYSPVNQDTTLYYQLPDYPPKIHAFARPASPQEVSKLFASTGYLHLLASSSVSFLPIEDILLALLKYYAEACTLSVEYLDSFISSYSLLIGNDYRRLKIFLQRLEPLAELYLSGKQFYTRTAHY
jgi:hypothetical protein